MARPYGLELLQALDNELDGRLGTELARVCVRANLPTQHLAPVFGVSRMTIHSWFRGKPIRSARHGAIERFMNKDSNLDIALLFVTLLSISAPNNGS